MPGDVTVSSEKARAFAAQASSAADERLALLRARSKRCVCKYCGSRLAVRLIDFGQIELANLEIFCTSCQMIEYGVEREIYQSAVYLVDHLGFNAYPDRTDNAATRRLNIGKICELLAFHDQRLGLLDDGGFRVPLDMDEALWDASGGGRIVLGARLDEE